MTLPETTPPPPLVETKETQCEPEPDPMPAPVLEPAPAPALEPDRAAALDDGNGPPVLSSASRSTSLSGGSRRTSEMWLGDGILGDGLLADVEPGSFIGSGRCSSLDEARGRGGGGCGGGFGSSLAEGYSNYGGYGGASTPMREILDGATVPTLPKYIFKAHEMTQGVRDLLQDCLHTDAVLVAADEEIATHTKILKVYGGALFAMVEEAGAEGRAKLPDIAGEVLMEVLRFVYTGTAPAVSRMPRALLAAAHRAGLPELKSRCAEVLVHRLDVHNVTEIFELADKNEEERLKQAAAVLFLENAKEIYDTEEWHASLDLRPAAAMRLVHIAVTKTSMEMDSMTTGTRIVHLIARIYMVAIVPVVGYVLYSTVRNKLRAYKYGENSTSTAPTTATGIIAEVVAAVNESVVAGVEEDTFFSSPSDEL